MNIRYKRFVAEYLKDGNGQAAAIRAGFAKNGAKVRACLLLKRPEIQAALDAARAPVLEEAQLTMDNHLRTLAQIRDKALSDKQYAAAVTAETNRGKVAGFYVERHAGPDGGPQEIKVTHEIVDPKGDGAP